MQVQKQTDDHPKFSTSDIVWAVLCASAMVTFSYTMVIWFGVSDVPWLFEESSVYTIVVRLISLIVLGYCWIFYPSKHM